MTSVLRPNPAAFDGHWYTPAQMARLAGVQAQWLAEQDRQGKLPARAVKRRVQQRDGFGRPVMRYSPRLYNAGKILAWQQQRKDGQS